MKIGIPKETKNHEDRVALTPESVEQLSNQGHTLIVQESAGAGINASDKDYEKAGAIIKKHAQTIFEQSDMIIKVKEPLEHEVPYLKKGQILFTYLHLAASKPLTKKLMATGAICIAYETVTGTNNTLPLLAPMSMIAGKLATQAAAYYLQHFVGGKGKLMGGVPGVLPAKVAIIGGGVVGQNAANLALGMGAEVTILEKNNQVMDSIDHTFNHQAKTLYASDSNLTHLIAHADVLIGAVLLPGSAAPKIVSEQMVQSMQPGSVIVDVAIDQGGCVATSHPTTYDHPIYTKHGIIHYCVTNMPGSVPHTATHALNNATLPFISQLAHDGWQKALANNPHLLNGLSIANGKLTCQHTAQSLNLDHTDPQSLLAPA